MNPWWWSMGQGRTFSSSSCGLCRRRESAEVFLERGKKKWINDKIQPRLWKKPATNLNRVHLYQESTSRSSQWTPSALPHLVHPVLQLFFHYCTVHKEKTTISPITYQPPPFAPMTGDAATDAQIDSMRNAYIQSQQQEISMQKILPPSQHIRPSSHSDIKRLFLNSS